MRILLLHLLLAVWLTMLCTNLLAQNTDTTIYRELGQVDVVGNGKRARSSVSQAFGRGQIKTVPSADIAGVLRLGNGLNIKDYGGIGGLKTVSVRSFGAAHTAVEYDGAPISNTQAGQIDISRFDAASISEIKVSVGQDDNLFKPAKMFASGAVLTLKSHNDNDLDNLKINLKTGSFGYFATDLALSKHLSKRLIIKADGAFLRSDGMYKYTLKNNKNISEQKRHNTDIISKKGEINLFYNDSNLQSFNLKLYGYDSRRGLPGSVIFYNDEANERLNDRNYFIQGDYKRRFFDALTTKVLVKYNYSFSHYTDRNVMYTDGKLTQNSTQREFFASWQNLWQIASPLTFSFAADYCYNMLLSDITDRLPKRYTVYSAANLRYYPAKWTTITVGTVHTHLREKTDVGTHLDDVDRFSPYLILKFYPTNKIAITTLYKNTFRVPTFNELYYTTLGSTNLKPEDAHEFNFGVSYNAKSWNVSTDFYRNNVDNKIVAIPTMYIWKMANCGRVKITGADVSASKHFRFANLAINLSAGYSYQKAEDVTDKNSKLYGFQIPYTPLHSGNGWVEFAYKNYTLSATTVWSGKRYFLKNNIKDNEIDPYAEISVALSRQFEFNGSEFFIKISCINITNKQYDIIKFYPMPGRQFQLHISYNLTNKFYQNEKD